MRHASCRCNRREFLGTAVPACAMTCLGITALPAALTAGHQAQPATKPPSNQLPRHVFDRELPGKLTCRALTTITYSESGFIPLIVRLDKTLGPARTIELLRANSTAQGRRHGRAAAEKSGANDMAALQNILTQGAEVNFWVVQVVESTDRVLEYRTTECLFAKTFQDGHADGELGYAALCYGDYAFAESFNPKIRLARDKTIMQGHGVCNHRYTFAV